MARFKKGEHRGLKTEFKKGFTPWNKGLKNCYSEETIKNMSKTRTGRPTWNKGKKGVQIVTQDTKEKMSISRKKFLNEHPEAIENLKLKMSREKHPNWQGGKSFEPYDKLWNDQLKEQIRKRDHYCCQECFRHQSEFITKTNKPYKLSVHHIDFDKKNSDPNNLISLCKSCHAKTNFNRKDWTNYFVTEAGGVFRDDKD